MALEAIGMVQQVKSLVLSSHFFPSINKTLVIVTAFDQFGR